MAVHIQKVSAEQLPEVVQAVKDAGQRILDVTVARLERVSRVSKEYVVTEYLVISQ
jgi:hypothetical protein